jgi:stress-induced morphogen
MLRSLLRPNTHALQAVRRLATEREAQLEQRLRSALQATKVVVKDVSGGCGAMFQLEVESPLFKGVPLVKQHRMVKEVRAGCAAWLRMAF